MILAAVFLFSFVCFENFPRRVYEKLMAEIDAVDNGFAPYDAGERCRLRLNERCELTAV